MKCEVIPCTGDAEFRITYNGPGGFEEEEVCKQHLKLQDNNIYVSKVEKISRGVEAS